MSMCACETHPDAAIPSASITDGYQTSASCRTCVSDLRGLMSISSSSKPWVPGSLLSSSISSRNCAASGVYLVRMAGDGVVRTRKLIVVEQRSIHGSPSKSPPTHDGERLAVS
jgi:hypothetical protein